MKMSRKYFFLLMGLLFAFNLMAGDKNSFLKRQFTTSDGYKLNYRILYPENYSPDKKYPLLLFLHGAGERGNDNEKQLFHGGDMLSSHENRSKYPCIILAPQCPENDYWVDYTHPETGMKRTYPENPAPSKQIKAVKELLDSYIAKDIVDTKRISVFGLSMGGMGTFDLVCRYPDLFVTATPICGAVNTKRLGKYKGKTAVVTEKITPESGRIAIYGETWQAKTKNGEEIEEGSQVKIVKIDSIVMYVEKV